MKQFDLQIACQNEKRNGKLYEKIMLWQKLL